MSDNKVNGLLGETMEKIKTMIDVNTVIGDPIKANSDVTIIPVSKVNYGFAAGGSDIPSKAQPSSGLFGGGSGAGITITPIAFLVVSGANVKVIQIEPFNSAVDRVIQSAPDVVDRIASMFKKEDKSEPEVLPPV